MWFLSLFEARMAFKIVVLAYWVNKTSWDPNALCYRTFLSSKITLSSILSSDSEKIPTNVVNWCSVLPLPMLRSEGNATSSTVWDYWLPGDVNIGSQGKKIRSYVNVLIYLLINFINSLCVAGNPFMLETSKARLDVRWNSFSHRIVSMWNSLPPSVIGCDSLNDFKNRKDEHFKRLGLVWPSGF